MDFFEKPKLVTAVVFFTQTMLALLNMKVFLYSGAFVFVLIPFFFGFPFAFYYTYKLIVVDLNKDMESEKEKIPANFTLKSPDVPGQKKNGTENEHGKEALHPLKIEPEEPLMPLHPKSAEPQDSKESAPVKNTKRIPVVDTNDVFSDKEPIFGAGQPIKRATFHRPTLNQAASPEALNPANEPAAVETAELAVPNRTEDQERA